MAIDLSYGSLAALLGPYQAKSRTESRAFLAWYLENIYRLEPTAAQDAVCDGPDDKGVDGIYVDEINSRIDVFQARTVQSDEKTVGDTQIKEFAGTLGQFANAESIDQLRETTTNLELRKLLEDSKLHQLVRDGYEVRGVFVTNARTHPGALDYLKTSDVNIVIRDRMSIQEAYVGSSHAPASRQPLVFTVFGFDVAQYQVGSARVVVAPLLASELVRMEGVQSGEIFDYNVRQYLGNTNVNKDIEKSVRDQQEHKNFLLYHNGLTVVAEAVDTGTEGQVTIADYVVVNGCQSVSVFWNKQDDLSPDLRILARLIELPRSSTLMDAITHHSNNQNGIKPRDFQSNNPIQLRLRNEFAVKYPDQVFYRISRGEESQLPVINDNELAARILLAFDLGEPWTSHQTYKLFDELHAGIFARPEVDADRVLALSDIYSAVEQELGQLENELLARYTLTKFFLVFLIREALESDELGRAFMKDPSAFMEVEHGRERLRECVKDILSDLIVDLNAEVQERDELGNPFDFKRDLKSESAVRNLSRGILSNYTKAVKRARAPSFADVWERSGTA